MPLGIRSGDRVCRPVYLTTVPGLKTHRCTLCQAQFLSLLLPEVGFLVLLELGVNLTYVVRVAQEENVSPRLHSPLVSVCFSFLSFWFCSRLRVKPDTEHVRSPRHDNVKSQ